jgi:serine/threonine-protein kinase
LPDLQERITTGLEDRYTIKGELGSGGMAVVYLAFDIKHERNVAVKVLRPEVGLALGPDRFLQEIKTTAQLSHPNILSLLDSGEVDGLLYYVMPFVEGETLRERMAREKQLSYDDAQQIVLEVGDALSYAHSRGVLHRDIKPENIMLESGHAIIADFGIARAISDANMSRLTQAGMVVGTPAYMSPEQAAGGGDLDSRSDVYSLGAVFYEMLVGSAPFEAPTPQAVMARQLSEEVPRIGEARDTVPPIVDFAVNKALQKLPADRFATIHQFLEALKQTELTTGETAQLKKLEGRSGTRTKWIAAAIAVLSLVGAAALYSMSGVAFDEHDWILIADFENSTGDSIFDESLNTALVVGLQQSHHLNVFPESRVAETLQRMGKPDVEKVDQAIGVEVALRENLRLLVVPRIGRVDSIYDLTFRIVDPVTGEGLKSRSVRANGKAEILPAMDKLAKRLRRDLGESMFEVARRDVRLEAATTPSLQALQYWSEGRMHFGQRRYEEAAALYRRALELDSNFALAHKDLGAVYYYNDDRPGGDPHFEKALALADRITERERLWIQAEILNWRAEREAAVDAYNVFLARYPEDRSGWFRLGYALMLLQRHDEAAAAFSRVLELDSLNAAAYINLATVEVLQHRYAEALPNYKKAFEINPAWRTSGNLNHEFGFTFAEMGDLDSARAVFELMLSESDNQEAQGRRSLGLLSLSTGKYHEGIEHLRQSVILYRTLNSDLSEYRSRLFLADAYRAIDAGPEFRTHLSRVGELARGESISPLWLAYAGKSYARNGMLRETGEILDLAVGRVNEDNQSDRAAIAFLRGEIALANGEYIEATEQFEMAYALQSNNFYLEAVAHGYFVSGDFEAAESKYLEVTEDKSLGWEAQDPWILSFYYLGRTREELGKTAAAAEAYSQFLDIWKDGDDDIVALADARDRLQRLVSEH